MSSVTLLGVAYDAGSSYRRGCAAAPALIRDQLVSSVGNSWSETLVNIADSAVLSDDGDIAPATHEMHRQVASSVTRILATESRPLVLGGDHSITYPIVSAVSRLYAPLTILHIDAHPDLYEEFEGNRYSHACPFARIMEEGLASRLTQVGIRTMTDHQQRQAHRFQAVVIDMLAWSSGDRPIISPDERVYVSIDVDAIDPAFAPGVSHPEPGGLSVREVLSIIQGLRCAVVGADVVECNPEVDPSGITTRVAAKLVKELVAQMHAQSLSRLTRVGKAIRNEAAAH